MPGKYAPVFFASSATLMDYLNLNTNDEQIILNPLKIKDLKLGYLRKGANVAIPNYLGNSTNMQLDYFQLEIEFHSGRKIKHEVMAPSAYQHGFTFGSKKVCNPGAAYESCSIVKLEDQSSTPYFDPIFGKDRSLPRYQILVDGTPRTIQKMNGSFTPAFLLDHKL